MFAGKKSAQIREILISESAWEEMTCLFAPSLAVIFPLMFYAYPTISTRYQYFYAIFMIGLSLSLLDYLKSSNLLLVILVMGLLFYIPFYRFITNPLSIVFVPYQNMITYDESNSTGQARTDELMTQLYQLWDK